MCPVIDGALSPRIRVDSVTPSAKQVYMDRLYKDLMKYCAQYSGLDDSSYSSEWSNSLSSTSSTDPSTPYAYTSQSSLCSNKKISPRFTEDFGPLGMPEANSPPQPLVPRLIGTDCYRRFLHNGPRPSGTALYLSSLFPSSIPRISPYIVETILFRFGSSPDATISLAGCIINGLSSMFFINWLKRLPPDVDIIHPEIILVVSLALSIKFLDDRSASLKYFLKLFREALAEFVVIVPTTIRDLVHVEMSILNDLNYDLMAIVSTQGLEYMNSQFERSGNLRIC